MAPSRVGYGLAHGPSGGPVAPRHGRGGDITRGGVCRNGLLPAGRPSGAEVPLSATSAGDGALLKCSVGSAGHTPRKRDPLTGKTIPVSPRPGTIVGTNSPPEVYPHGDRTGRDHPAARPPAGGRPGRTRTDRRPAAAALRRHRR